MKLKVLIAFLIVAPAMANAQYMGPNSKRTNYTIEEIVANAKTFSKARTLVTLKGFITEQLADADTYVFKDVTGTITAIIPPDNLPSKPFDDTHKVLVIATIKAKKTNTLLVSKTIILQMPMEAKVSEAPVSSEKAEMNSMDPLVKPEQKEVTADEIVGNKDGIKEEAEKKEEKPEVVKKKDQ